VTIGIIATGNGSALDSVLSLLYALRPDVHIVGFSDRDCGAFETLQKHCKSSMKFETESNQEVSEAAYSFFSSQSCSCVVLSYSRLVTESLYGQLDCFNLHPSLLPNYRGFGAVKAAFLDSKNVQLGATIHRVDESIDGGPIVCQVSTSPAFSTLEYWQSISYLMRVLLLTAFLDQRFSGHTELGPNVLHCYPFLKESLFITGISVSDGLRTQFIKILRDSHAHYLTAGN
jgi:folate-dependent phosphoribosylglycinamide formyltransferase PurN